MTPKQLRTKLHNFLDLLFDEDIAIHTNQVGFDQIREVIRVTWRSRRDLPVSVDEPHFGSIDEYCGFLEAQAFSAILFDGALIQMSYDFRYGELVGHRLCFYPCPYDIDTELLVDEPILDVIEVYRKLGSRHMRLRSPIRFDFDSGNVAEQHPAVHVHLLWAHCRFPVVAPLGVGDFFRFIFMNFYPNLWSSHHFLQNLPQDLANRTITKEEELDLHFACRRS